MKSVPVLLVFVTRIHRSASASASCRRRAPQSEISAFIFFSGNKFDEILLHPVVLESKRQIRGRRRREAAGRWRRRRRRKRHLIKKNQSEAASPLRRKINSSWWRTSKNTFLLLNNLHVWHHATHHQCHLTNTQKILKTFSLDDWRRLASSERLNQVAVTLNPSDADLSSCRRQTFDLIKHFILFVHHNATALFAFHKFNKLIRNVD